MTHDTDIYEKQLLITPLIISFFNHQHTSYSVNNISLMWPIFIQVDPLTIINTSLLSGGEVDASIVLWHATLHPSMELTKRNQTINGLFKQNKKTVIQSWAF